jgi:hypothetical protein
LNEYNQKLMLVECQEVLQRLHVCKGLAPSSPFELVDSCIEAILAPEKCVTPSLVKDVKATASYSISELNDVVVHILGINVVPTNLNSIIQNFFNVGDLNSVSYDFNALKSILSILIPFICAMCSLNILNSYTFLDSDKKVKEGRIYRFWKSVILSEKSKWDESGKLYLSGSPSDVLELLLTEPGRRVLLYDVLVNRNDTHMSQDLLDAILKDKEVVLQNE